MTPEGTGRVSKPGLRLPDFPWDKLTSYAATARAHPDGIVDLSIGTPVDPTPAVVQDAACGRRLAGLSHDDRPARDETGGHRLAGPPLRRHRPWPRRRPAGDRLQGAHRLDGGASRHRPRRPDRLPRARLPDLRGRRSPSRGHHDLTRFNLVAHLIDHLRRWADENDPFLFAARGERSVLARKP